MEESDLSPSVKLDRLHTQMPFTHFCGPEGKLENEKAFNYIHNCVYY